VVKYAIGLPNVGPFGDPRLLLELGTLAERSGWDGVFVWDHLLYHDQSWPLADPTVVLAALATATTRVRLGVLMSALARRRPQKFAREQAGLDHLSGGRLVCGVGLGSMPAEYAAFGEDPDPRARAARLDEALEVVTGLWTGQPTHHAGPAYTVDGVTMRPTPVQRPRIPIWCAGRWPARAPLRRAARWDGVVPTAEGYGRGRLMPVEVLGEIVQTVREHRGHLDGFEVVMEGHTDGAEADRGAATVDRYRAVGLTWWIEALGWWRGGVDAAVDRIRQGPPASTG
jgi:alkanesulfonate monooxygenase SsuD/methylene tetrahydromethanopterin reductase-like flavin-dependent oxidoreductase (luciferase family)